MSEQILLAPRLDLSAASELKTTLLEKAGNDVELDFANVKIIGALCLQVLVAASRLYATTGAHLKIRNLPDRVEAQMRIVGVTPEIIAGDTQ